MNQTCKHKMLNKIKTFLNDYFILPTITIGEPIPNNWKKICDSENLSEKEFFEMLRIKSLSKLNEL